MCFVECMAYKSEIHGNAKQKTEYTDTHRFNWTFSFIPKLGIYVYNDETSEKRKRVTGETSQLRYTGIRSARSRQSRKKNNSINLFLLCIANIVYTWSLSTKAIYLSMRSVFGWNLWSKPLSAYLLRFQNGCTVHLLRIMCVLCWSMQGFLGAIVLYLPGIRKNLHKNHNCKYLIIIGGTSWI